MKSTNKDFIGKAFVGIDVHKNSCKNWGQSSIFFGIEQVKAILKFQIDYYKRNSLKLFKHLNQARKDDHIEKITELLKKKLKDEYEKFMKLIKEE